MVSVLVLQLFPAASAPPSCPPLLRTNFPVDSIPCLTSALLPRDQRVYFVRWLFGRGYHRALMVLLFAWVWSPAPLLVVQSWFRFSFFVPRVCWCGSSSGADGAHVRVVCLPAESVSSPVGAQGRGCGKPQQWSQAPRISPRSHGAR